MTMDDLKQKMINLQLQEHQLHMQEREIIIQLNQIYNAQYDIRLDMMRETHQFTCGFCKYRIAEREITLAYNDGEKYQEIVWLCANEKCQSVTRTPRGIGGGDLIAQLPLVLKEHYNIGNEQKVMFGETGYLADKYIFGAEDAAFELYQDPNVYEVDDDITNIIYNTCATYDYNNNQVTISIGDRQIQAHSTDPESLRNKYRSLQAFI